MFRSLHPDSILPFGLVVDPVEVGSGLTITARSLASSARSPTCDRRSSRSHNRSTRHGRVFGKTAGLLLGDHGLAVARHRPKATTTDATPIVQSTLAHVVAALSAIRSPPTKADLSQSRLRHDARRYIHRHSARQISFPTTRSAARSGCPGRPSIAAFNC